MNCATGMNFHVVCVTLEWTYDLSINLMLRLAPSAHHLRVMDKNIRHMEVFVYVILISDPTVIILDCTLQL